MANQIVVLSTSTNQADSSFTVAGVFWLVVPTNNVIPLPKFTSQVPFIDQGTLGQLRLGTLLEQSFTTSTFPSGTSLATVQSSLQTLFTAAQTALNNTASPLAGLVATEYTGLAWVSVASGLVVFDPVGRLVTDIYWAAAAGLIPGVTTGRATGYVSTSAASNKAIMATTYTPQGTNAQRSLVSTSANDSSSGTGAQQVTITYLDAAFAVHTEVVTLNGTNPVNTVGTNYAYIESMVVTQVGSTGTNQGQVDIYTGTAGSGSIWGSIAVNGGVGDNQTFWCHHYVPAGVTCYILSMECTSYSVLGTMYLAHSGNPSATNLPWVQIGPTVLHPAGDYREHDFTSALAVTGPDLIELFTRPSTATADTSLGNFEYIQF
jgi:hypothetical protein